MLVPRMSAAWQKRHLLSRTRVCDQPRSTCAYKGAPCHPVLIHDSLQKTSSALSAESYADVGESATSACSCTRRAGQCYAMLCSAVQCSAVSATQHSAVPCQYPRPSQPCATAPRTAMRDAPAPTVPAGSARRIGRAWRDREGNGRSLGRATSRVSSDI